MRANESKAGGYLGVLWLAFVYSFGVHRKNRFTLIELLVVISIIAIVASLLLPNLGAAKQRTLLISCMNNLRASGNALQMYSNDWNGHIPVTEDDVAVGAQRNTLRIWGNAQPRNIGRIYRDQLDSAPEIAFCPGDTVYTPAGSAMGTGLAQWGSSAAGDMVEGSYTWRFTIDSPDNREVLHQNRANPTMLLCEQWPANPGEEKWCHNGEQSNALFFDGSAATIDNENDQLTAVNGSRNAQDEEPMEVADGYYDR